MPEATRRDAERLLREAGAMLDGHFQLSSGRHSGRYVEKFRVLERPQQTEALCRMLADWTKHLEPSVVAGPTTGGIVVSYETARQLRLRSIFAEKNDGSGRSFERGFQLSPADRVLVVDDVLTTGGSIRDVLDAVRAAGAQTVAVGVLIDRSGGKVDFGVPLYACLPLELPTYEPGAATCPLCAEDVPLTIT